VSPVLAGERTIDDIMINSVEWYAEKGITLHTGQTMVDIDHRTHTVIADDGTEKCYDRLLLASGSSPFIIPVPGQALLSVSLCCGLMNTICFSVNVSL
jgi:nitrite reductase (NADH) large subunit